MNDKSNYHNIKYLLTRVTYMKNKIRKSKITTTYLWLYIALFIISILLIIFNAEKETYNNCAKIFLNIGYGLFSSNSLAFLIDLINTSIENKQNREKFEYFIRRIKGDIHNLREEVVEQSGFRHSNYDDLLTFEEWIEYVFMPYEPNDMDDDDFNRLINEIIIIVRRIENTAMNLSKKSLYFDNKYCTVEFIKGLKELKRDCKKIEISFDLKKYDKCKEYLINPLAKRICHIFPEMRSLFTEKYNNSDDDT